VTANPPSRGTRASVESVAYQAAAIMLAFAIPTLGAMILDDRQLNGISVWDKPLKFEISLSVHLLTLGILSRILTAGSSARPLVRGAFSMSAFMAVAEISYIVVQAARGRQSHFNFETPVEAIMYAMMGLGATALVVCAFIIGFEMRRSVRPEVGDGLESGAAWGLMLGAVATFITAGVMSAGIIGGRGHWVGGMHSDAHGMPLTGWSMTGGDLRVAHFLATHMMQALPLIGYLGDRWLPKHARQLVWLAAALAVLVVAAAFIQAAVGLPLIPQRSLAAYTSVP
jgi:hypothetical protein